MDRMVGSYAAVCLLEVITTQHRNLLEVMATLEGIQSHIISKGCYNLCMINDTLALITNSSSI